MKRKPSRKRPAATRKRPSPRRGDASGSRDVLRYLRHHGPTASRALAVGLGIESDGFADFVDGLHALENEGVLVYAPSGRGRVWELTDTSSFRVGYLSTDRRGSGYARLLGGDEDDVFVPASRLKDAFTGDRVLLRLMAPPRGPRLAEARIVEVLERSRRPLRGTYWKAKQGGIVEISDPRAPSDVFVPRSKSSRDVRDGETVLVRLRESSGGVRPEGDIVTSLGDGEGYDADLASVIAEFELKTEHGRAELDAAEALRGVGAGADWPDRKDCRGLTVFTIDPEDARDFDDAISFESLPKGQIRLGVHIADVSHYVKPQSVLDAAAAERSTSVYLPGRVLPMLPERISNDLCSLRPREDRLTKSVFLTFASDGELVTTEIARSVIHSRRRFTYEEVQAILDSIAGQPAEGKNLPADHEEYREVIRELDALRVRLNTKRRERGALFLDLPKIRLQVDDDGEVVGLGREERDASHELIEEFMLAANEAVARYFVNNSLPLIGRAHSQPDPEKLEDFRELLGAVGFQLEGGTEAGDFQKLVAEVAASPLASAIQLALLRTMPHAEYVPHVAPHFALATEAYCHFTSPIRRYPDLIVHQVLDEHLAARAHGRKLTPKKRAAWDDRLEEIAPFASKAERNAESAERAMHQLGLIRFLQTRIGEEMDGWIVSVHPFGFVVRIEELLIEGIVHVATLPTYFEFDRAAQLLREKKKRGDARSKDRRRRRRDESRADELDSAGDVTEFRLGQPVRVVLHGLDPAAREIRFQLA